MTSWRSHAVRSVNRRFHPVARSRGTGKIVSFHYTTDQVTAGSKTVTRRDWSDKYAERFKPGDICQAWTHSPHRGGKFIRQIRIVETRMEHLAALADPHYGPAEMRREGFPGRDPAEFEKTFFSKSRRTDGTVWRIEFEYV